MILGIDCSRYAARNPTGVEIYTDRILDALIPQVDHLGYSEVRLYLQTKAQEEKLKALLESTGQKMAKLVLIEQPRFWTVFFLSLELYRNPIDFLFVPSHTMPLVIPRKSLLTVHGIEALSIPEAYRIHHSLAQQFFLWHSKWLGTDYIAVSKAVIEDLKKYFLMPDDRVTVIYHGYDPKQDKKGERTLPITIDGEYILHLGRLEDRKNQLRLIEAFEQIAKEYPKISLVLVGGDGHHADRIRKRAETSPVKKRIHFTGYQDREMVQMLLEKAVMLAHPSLAEGFGMPILEAFDVGVPVLTSKGSAMEEIAGEAALLCDPFSVDSIAQGMKFYLADEKIRKEKVVLGKKRLADFSWEKCIEATKALITAAPGNGS